MNTLRTLSISLLTTCLALAWVAPASAQMSDAEAVEFFEAKIRPVLVRECYGCHSQQTGQAKGGLKLDTRQGLLLGGDSGASLVPGDFEESPLWSAINYEDYAMPPNKQLPASVIEDFRIWIEAGAPDPRIPEANGDAISQTVTNEDIRKGKQFWSFQRPRRPAMPETNNEYWPKGSIDQFVLHDLEQNEMEPAPDAEPFTLLRRLHFDLVGLPPTVDEIHEFNKLWDDNPDSAVARTVDRLLDSPAFGERWGRHWLDVARYAESTGKELNSTFPHAWRYRDYVIDSFNEDKPYDQFVREQLAGDLMPARTNKVWSKNLIATGFLAVGPKTLQEQNPRQFRADLVDEQIDVSTRVILGVSVACARCHDHKFDPIPQSDYYAMAGIFASTNTYYGTLDNRQNRRPSDLILLPTDDPENSVEPMSPEDIQKLKEALAEAKIDLRKAYQARREARRKGTTGQTSAQRAAMNVGGLSSRVSAIQSVIDSVNPDGSPKTFCMGVQPSDKPADVNLLVRGEVDQPGPVVPRGFVQVIGGKKSKIRNSSSGRLELAKWMTDESNPLTARVMMNRVWKHMMGQGIVETTENFGSTGMPPTHPELLDYLANQLMDNRWSLKSMIREIATSRTYRMSSQYNQDYFTKDPDNKLMWRSSPRRLEAEAIRDSMLSVAGKLDLERPYASEVAKSGNTIARGGQLRNLGGTIREVLKQSDSMEDQVRNRRRGRNRGLVNSADPKENFRSVYLPVVRDSYPRALAVFDFAESSMVVGRRETSNTPDQGLYFLNNKTVQELSGDFAKRLVTSYKDHDEQVANAFLMAYGRPATVTEMQAARNFLDEFESQASGRNGRVEKLSYLCQAIMAAAEFRIVN